MYKEKKLYQMDVAHAVLFAKKIDISRATADYSSAKFEVVILTVLLFWGGSRSLNMLAAVFLHKNKAAVRLFRATAPFKSNFLKVLHFTRDSKILLHVENTSNKNFIHPNKYL